MRICNYCTKSGATIDCGDTAFHQDCFSRMPAKYVFLPTFWKKRSAQDQLVDEVKKKTKDGKFIL